MCHMHFFIASVLSLFSHRLSVYVIIIKCDTNNGIYQYCYYSNIDTKGAISSIIIFVCDRYYFYFYGDDDQPHKQNEKEKQQ